MPVLSAARLPARTKSLPSAVLVVGQEPLLRREALAWLRQAASQGQNAWSDELHGPDVTWEEVARLWSTRGLFSSRRVVLLQEAHAWVRRYRAELEKALKNPPPHNTLVLVADQEASSTRVYKQIDRHGLVIRCEAPSGDQVLDWLQERVQRVHGCTLDPDAAQLLVERIGNLPALLDQELAKLAAYAGPGAKITAPMVKQLVGSWRTQAVWDLIDAALEGNAPAALEQLDRLLQAGEEPLRILAAFSYVLRRMAEATEIFLQHWEAGRRLELETALAQAGEKRFVLSARAAQLRQLGRWRGRELLAWCTEADAALKGFSQLPPRVVLERLLVRLSKRMRPSGTSAAAGAG